MLVVILSFNPVNAAEFLVYAKTHWMESVDRTGWSAKQLKEYGRRLVKGNPIVVRPDGWKWGKRERPPDFVVIKVPDMSVKEAVGYLVDAKDTSVLPNVESGEYPTKYRRKYQFSTTDVDTASSLTGVISTTKTAFTNKLTDRE